MTNSRSKGARFERWVAQWLRSLGFPTARRGQQFKGTSDSPDVIADELRDLFAWECKHVEQYSLSDVYTALAKLHQETGVGPLTVPGYLDALVPVLVYKRNGCDPLCIVNYAFFERLIESHYANHGALK